MRLMTRVGHRCKIRWRNEARRRRCPTGCADHPSRNWMNFDPRLTAMHNIVAATRFPGPRYYEVLEWLHQELRPATYVEIGVFEGDSLRLANPPTRALGIDSSPPLKGDWRTE